MEDRFDDLKERLDKRFRKGQIRNINLNLYHFINILQMGIDPYNNILIDDILKFKDELNSRILIEKEEGKNIPLIKEIYPSVISNYPNHIDIYFMNENNNYIGSVILYDNHGVDACIDNNYSTQDTLNFLDYYKIYTDEYFEVLKSFSNKYPNTNYQWGTPSKEKVQLIKDDLLKAYLNLERLDNIELTFSNFKDFELQYEDIDRYKELETILKRHKYFLLKSMNVDYSKLNSLYKDIYENALNDKNEKKLTL